MSRDVVWLADHNYPSYSLNSMSHRKTQDYRKKREDGQDFERNCNDDDANSSDGSDSGTLSKDDTADDEVCTGDEQESVDSHNGDYIDDVGSDDSRSDDRNNNRRANHPSSQDIDHDGECDAIDGHAEEDATAGRSYPTKS